MKKILTTCIIGIFIALSVNAQTMDDAIRYVMPNAMNTTRSGGLGVAFHGINDDIASLYFNPAGLTLIPESEFNFGVGFMTNTSETDYLGNQSSYNRYDLYMPNIGIAGVVEDSDKKIVFGLGHFYESNYKTSSKTSAFNTNSSLIGFETAHGPQPGETARNWAYELYLADRNADGTGYNTDYTKDLQQTSRIMKNGGLHNIAVGAAIDLTNSLSFGGSLTMKFGGFEYNRQYIEWDKNNVYDDPSKLHDLERLEINEFYDNSIIGLTAELGMQARISDFLRVSVGVQMPTWLSFEESYGADYHATYAMGNPVSWSPYSDYRGDTLVYSYDVITPFVYSAGISTHFSGVTISAGAEYANTSSTFFLDPDDLLEETNDLINEAVQSQLKWGAGIEWMVPIAPVQIRASYENVTSPYKNDIDDANIQNIAGGISLFFNKQLRVDIGARYSTAKEFYYLYGWEGIDQYATYTQDNTALDVVLGMAYRF